MTQTPRKLLVTSALLYANGPLHLGHVVELIQTDIWVRTQRALGHHCTYISGDDAHGTPIMLKAEKLGITPEALIEQMHAEHRNVLSRFNVSVDNYHTTHSAENEALTHLIYERLNANGDISSRAIMQSYDPLKNMFLPDRYVKGTCPRCKTADQYGDSCEQCGATYSPTELIDPISVVSGATPIQKESEHYFFELPRYENFLQTFLHELDVQSSVKHKLQEWFESGLRDWDISRDAPYFGFEIPGHPNKYFYVWMDAPIGYIASFKNLCNTRDDLNFDEYWAADSTVELHHFIGKDIIYFHTLFWPAMLKGANIRQPNSIHSHGFLTIDGKKMSKSRGTFINAATYLDNLNPDYLRYYIAAKLNSTIEDIDLNFADFINRVNADLVGKVINIASRQAGFVQKYFDGTLSASLPEPELYQAACDERHDIAALLESGDYSQAVRRIMLLADKVNQYIDEYKPWQLIKEAGKEADVHGICTQSINLFRVLMTYLAPIIPSTASQAAVFLRVDDYPWDAITQPLLNHRLDPFVPLMQRIEPAAIEKLKADAIAAAAAL